MPDSRRPSLQEGCAPMPTSYGFLSTYTPTECGLATFTAALATELRTGPPAGRIGVVRVVDRPECGVRPEIVHHLVAAGRKSRLLKDHGLEEATSTRALVYAANMMNAGLDPVASCQVAMVNPITDDVELADAMMEIVQAHFSA